MAEPLSGMAEPGLEHQRGRQRGQIGPHPALGRAELVRCFSFLDLCGFTDFVENKGPERASEVLTAVRSSIRVVSSAYGVRVAKWLGDGALIVGTEIKSALAATLEVKADVADRAVPLELRGGVAAGKALVFEGDDYIGRPLNVAAKLCALAEPGTILAPAELAREHLDVVEILDEVFRRMPGSPEPVRLASIAQISLEPGQARAG
jgi:class 3 adenylate cyclase